MHSDRSEDGSALVLMPAAVLVLVVLAGIAVDAAAVFLGQQRLADLAAGIAHDGVAALDEAAFYGQGEVALVRERIEQRRDAVVATHVDDASLLDVACSVTVGEAAVTVACTGRARAILGRAVPGTPRLYDIRATQTARGAQG